MSIRETEVIPFSDEMSMEEKEQLKRSVLEKMKKDMRKSKQNYRWKTWKIVAAAASAAIIIPSSALAADQIAQLFHNEVHKDGYQLDIDIQKDSKADHTKSETIKEGKGNPVVLEYKIPDEYTMNEKGGGWYSFNHKEGFDAGKDFGVELLKVDKNVEKKFLLDDVGMQEEIKVGDNNGIYVKFNGLMESEYEEESINNYGQRVLVFDEKQGYILQIYAMNGIEKEKLLKYASGITLKPCEQGEECASMLLSEYIKTKSDVEKDTPLQGIDASHVVSEKETILFHGIEYEVNEVQVSDTLETIMKENGKGTDGEIWENRLEYSDKKGKLKTYTRETIEYGDGHTTPSSRVVGRKDVAQKFVLVELRVKNTTKKVKQDVEACLKMDYMTEENGTYVYDTTSYYRPRVVEDCQCDNRPQYFKETNGGKGFYLKDLQPGQEEVYHIGYFVDEDYLDNMFLAVDNSEFLMNGMEYEGAKIDIRK